MNYVLTILIDLQVVRELIMLDKNSEIQRQYYINSAVNYDNMHLASDHEHDFSLAIMNGIISYANVTSVLDVGSGTGRVIEYLQHARPDIHAIGVEPVAELRAQGHKKGIPENRLINGDATKLQFEDGSFDLVCEFAVLHHIAKPELAVSEMLRVAKRAIFISDSNRFGQGSLLSRKLKQLIASMGLWNIANQVKTKGKGYTLSEGDGLAYSYSVFDNYDQIRKACRSVHIVNTTDAGPNLYNSAGSVALLGMKL